jgi:predicted RNA methylase
VNGDGSPGTHRVVVSGVPGWVDAARLLGHGPVDPGARGVPPAGWTRDAAAGWTATLPTAVAADLDARLRNLCLGGSVVECTATPALPRAAVRAARLHDARRRRDTTPGFDVRGTQRDEEGRWSLTPAGLALALGRKAARRYGAAVRVLDLCGGVGGNAIGFARAGLRVVSVERDPVRAAMARHNAGMHGVAVDVRCDDALSVLGGVADLSGTLVHVDPPWGVAWERGGLDPTALAPLAEILRVLSARPDARAPRAVWLKLPPSADVGALPGFQARAVWGLHEGDARRVKFLLAVREAQRSGAQPPSSP